MGVQGLWDLLAPVGRRVSVETLAGKKLAIDASIWMVQFMKAMRDERGEMVRNAHLLGFFRRICKLLYLRTKPVFVFDGGTPALKRRTVIARRRQRENAQAKIRKTAEKLLLNHLKAMRLKELEKDLEEQRRNQKNGAKGRKADGKDAKQRRSNLEKLDQLGCRSTSPGMEAEDECLNKNATTLGAAAVTIGEEDNDDDEEMILPKTTEDVDPAVLSALPPSIQRNLLLQKNNAKGKKILVDDQDEPGMGGILAGGSGVELRNYSQEKLDEMLAASIAAEEDANLTNNMSPSAAAVPFEEDDGDEGEEMVLPAIQGNIDPAVLASLPPSMQLDLLVQMRESLMAENRQKYQKVKKAPEKFSELQIQSYLKTVAFRREIDEVQKAAAGRGVGGVQTSRIASEANREFIFSSSFTGDKQLLTSSRGVQNGDEQKQMQSEHPLLVPSSSIASGSKDKAVSGLVPDESGSDFNGDVETYLDERGRVRLNKVRAMGIHMTRDLQRNLDLMKEIERETTNANKIGNAKSVLKRKADGTPKSSGKNQFVETIHDDDSELADWREGNEPSLLKNGTSMEISFEYDGENKHSDDDDIFAGLVAGDPVKISSASADNISRKESSDSASDSDWEEGTLEGKHIELSNDIETEMQPSSKEGGASYESEVEWEEHNCDVSGSWKTMSKCYLEEEADLQEAIKRSLMDQSTEKSDYASAKHKESKSHGVNAVEAIDLFDEENYTESVGGTTEAIDSSARELKSSIAHSDNKGTLTNEPCESNPTSDSEQVKQDESDRAAEPVLSVQVNEAQRLEEQCFDASDGGGRLSTLSDSVLDEISDTFMAGDKKNGFEAEQPIVAYQKNVTKPEPSILVHDDINDRESEPSRLIYDKKNDAEAEPSCHLTETAGTSMPLVDLSAERSDIDIELKVASEKTQQKYFTATENSMAKSASMHGENMPIEFTEAGLEEEVHTLNEERVKLGDEWRKLERNAESVSSEMFAECQELLQMFGLPFIIAPMEAEAQCAYLELANLVDGIVTDDSDVFLFGGRSVYKNIFDDRKYVETYFMKDIENELGLSREKLIRMALLLGSDYTEGVSGIGIVNAIEVVNSFPEEDGLHKFREWIESPDPTILGKLDVQTGSSAKKKDGNGSKDSPEGDITFDQANVDKQSADYTQEIKQIFMDKHRNVSKNWHIPSNFPSEAVISAYFCPQVDKSTESFAWSKPDLLVLRRLCWEKFGWGSQKSDDLLLPVLKEYSKHETQLRLEAFYTFNERFAKIRSKRIKKAVKGITRNKSVLADDAKQELSTSTKKRRFKPSEAGDKTEKPSEETEENIHRNKSKSMEKLTPKQTRKSNHVEKSTSKQSRKRRHFEEPIPFEAESPNTEQQVEEEITTNRGSQGNGRVRGRGRGKGRGRGTGRGRGRGNVSLSSSEGNISDNEREVDAEKSEGSEIVRRSTRPRKLVNYTMDDMESENIDKLADQSNTIGSVEKSVKRDSSFDEEMNEDVAVSEDEHELGNRSLGEAFNGDNLEREGGFCRDDDEIRHSALRENQDSPSEASELSKDYLTTGGGFCLEENETNEDQDAVKDPAADTIMQTAGPFLCSDFAEGADHSIIPIQSVSGPQGGGRMDAFDAELNRDSQENSTDSDHPNIESSLPENSKDDTVPTSTAGGLRAMPFLRKKRRKS